MNKLKRLLISLRVLIIHRKSGLFDPQWYLDNNPDVKSAKKNPWIHFALHGAFEGRNPHPVFDSAFYLENNPDVAASNTVPYLHFIRHGLTENRSPNPFFNPGEYLALNPDVRRSGAPPVWHYVMHGHLEGRKISIQNNSYISWLEKYENYSKYDDDVYIHSLSNPPLLSVLMPVYEPNIDWLKEAVESVRAQIYQNWELCIADDASSKPEVKKVLDEYAKQDNRIKICYRSVNGHISAATNSALELAQGEFIALLDQDDLLQDHALAFVVKAIQEHPEVGLIYSDEDKIDGEVRSNPYFKSAWDPYLMRCHNMVCHLGVYRTALVKKLGGLREGFEGSQDWDLALRCADSLEDHQIIHIPRVLYHWRIHQQSTAMSGSGAKPYTLAAAKRAIEEHLSRRGVSAHAELIPEMSMFRVKYDLPKQKPLVSIVIATRDRIDLLKNCIDSIRKKTDYLNYEIIIVDNGSEDRKTLDYFQEIKQSGIAGVFRDEGDFNFSRLNNLGVQHANGEYILLLNNDIEVESQAWLSEMVALAIQPEIGCVGARLWYPHGRLQHGGVILGLGGFAAHAHRGMPREHAGYYGRGGLSHTMSAVTAACLLVRKSIYNEVGGLDEEHLAIGYNDVDFCLKVRSLGYRNLLCAEADLIHHESASRGEDLSGEKLSRFRREGHVLRSRWGNLLDNDPAYNPNLTSAAEDFGIAWPPRELFLRTGRRIYQESIFPLQKQEKKPVISVILPTYNTGISLLKNAIESVINQTYPYWELCISDDCSPNQEVQSLIKSYAAKDSRIKVSFRTKNGHISEASNSALELASGDWVAFLDHDDLLALNALHHVVVAIMANPNLGMIYSDEDKIDEEGNRFDPHFKSDWNPALFFSQNYICHLTVIRRHIVHKVGGLRIGVEGSQDYDLILRCLPFLQAHQIHHIPKILYHWRAISGSTASAASEKSYSTAAGIKALTDYFAAQKVKVKVKVKNGLYPNTYNVVYPIPDPSPLVSLVIPTRDQCKITKDCVCSILSKTTYKNFEIILVDNGSSQRDALKFFQEIQKADNRVKVLKYNKPFNYSAINNFAVMHCGGSVVGFVNNDIQVVSPDWLAEMVSHASRAEIGCVGAKLFYTDGRIQHAGVILGIGGVAGHSHKYFPGDHPGYFTRLKLTQNLSAVTAACLLVRRSVFLEVNGFEENHLAIAFNDIDLCLKVREAGYRNLWTPYAELYHHESVSRGHEDSPEKIQRFESEARHMKEKWGEKLLWDPYYNENLTLDREDFSLR